MGFLLSRPGGRLVAIVVAAAVAPLQSAPPQASAGGTQIVSPSVVATTFSRLNPSGRASLDLLVLWRGAAGWFSSTGGSAMSTREEPAAGRRDGDLGVLVHHASFGAHVLRLRFDRATRIVEIQGVEVPLGDANVVLVDHIDNAGGPTISGTHRVEWKVDRGPTSLRPLLRSSPVLLEFLRCDTRLNDPSEQALVHSIVCEPS